MLSSLLCNIWHIIEKMCTHFGRWISLITSPCKHMQITAMQIEFVHIMIISLIYDTKFRIKTTQIIWLLSDYLWQRVFYFCYYSLEGFACNLQAQRRLWLVWMRRLEMSSCLLRPVKSARRPSLCGRRTTNSSVTVPEWLSQLKAERKLDLWLCSVSFVCDSGTNLMNHSVNTPAQTMSFSLGAWTSLLCHLASVNSKWKHETQPDQVFMFPFKKLIVHSSVF